MPQAPPVQWSVNPVAEKVRESPGENGNPTNTGEWAGAESPSEAVDPLGIPANQGSEVEGTVTIVSAIAPENTKNEKIKNKTTDEMPTLRNFLIIFFNLLL